MTNEKQTIMTSIENIRRLFYLCNDSEVRRDLSEAEAQLTKAYNSKTDKNRQLWLDRAGKTLLHIKGELNRIKEVA